MGVRAGNHEDKEVGEEKRKHGKGDGGKRKKNEKGEEEKTWQPGSAWNPTHKK